MAFGDAVSRVLSALGQDPVKSGKEWKFLCPAHEDKHRSLDVSQGEKGAVLCCRSAGCPTQKILDAIGLSFRDLFDEEQVDRPYRWEIRRPDGSVVAVHQRIDPAYGGKKQMWWEQPDGTTGLNGTAAADLPLYGCEDLAKRPKDVVVLCEGEKAADAVCAKGMLGLGTVCGANEQPSDEVLACLADRDVVLWPDADEVGLRHMKEIGERIEETAASVGVISTAGKPLGFDAADFDGGEIAMRKLVEKACRRVPFRSYGEIMESARKSPREWLIPDLIPYGAVILLSGGAKKAGKSTFAWSLGAAVEHGTAFLGQGMTKGRVIFLTEEADPDVADKIEKFRLDPKSGTVLSRSAIEGSPRLAESVRAAVRVGKRSGSRILIVDTFAWWAALEGSTENDAGTVMAALRPLSEAADQGFLVILVHHVSKREGAEGGMAARGSTALPGAVEATLELTPHGGAEHPTRRKLHVESRAVGVKDLFVDMVAGDASLGTPTRFDLAGEVEKITGGEVESKIIALLSSKAPRLMSGEEILAEITGQDGAINAALPRLFGKKKITRAGKGKRGDPYIYGIQVSRPENPSDENRNP